MSIGGKLPVRFAELRGDKRIGYLCRRSRLDPQVVAIACGPIEEEPAIGLPPSRVLAAFVDEKRLLLAAPERSREQFTITAPVDDRLTIS